MVQQWPEECQIALIELIRYVDENVLSELFRENIHERSFLNLILATI